MFFDLLLRGIISVRLKGLNRRGSAPMFIASYRKNKTIGEKYNTGKINRSCKSVLKFASSPLLSQIVGVSGSKSDRTTTRECSDLDLRNRIKTSGAVVPRCEVN